MIELLQFPLVPEPNKCFILAVGLTHLLDNRKVTFLKVEIAGTL